MPNKVIALFEFTKTELSIGVVAEKLYRLVPNDELSAEDLERYSRLSE